MKLFTYIDKYKTHLTILYVVILILGFLFARSALSVEEIDEYDNTEKHIEDVTEERFNLTIKSGSKVIDYSTRLKTDDGFEDLLEQLRNNDTFTYEKTAYIHGTRLDNINGIKASEGYIWKIYKGTEDVTNWFEDVGLDKDVNFTIALEKSN